MEQGNVFRLIMARSNVKFGGLNPFGTGQCLSTYCTSYIGDYHGLNPFGTGQCLSTKILRDIDQLWKSQSLWNRAMSFDR